MARPDVATNIRKNTSKFPRVFEIIYLLKFFCSLVQGWANFFQWGSHCCQYQVYSEVSTHWRARFYKKCFCRYKI